MSLVASISDTKLRNNTDYIKMLHYVHTKYSQEMLQKLRAYREYVIANKPIGEYERQNIEIPTCLLHKTFTEDTGDPIRSKELKVKIQNELMTAWNKVCFQ